MSDAAGDQDAEPIAVVGGGISGIAAAVELAAAGRRVILFEKRAFLGGRATSFTEKETGEEIDNCQHVVLGCCTNVLDLFARLGVADRVRFTDAFYYLTPDGRRHVLAPSFLPAPLHFAPALLGFGALTIVERLAVVRGLMRMMALTRAQLEALRELTMRDWLVRAGQPAGAIERFWRPILVSAVNEDLERAAALPCLQVFLQGFLPHRRASLMGVPAGGLASLYAEPAQRYLLARGSEVRTRTKIERLLIQGERVTGLALADGRSMRVGAVVVALPPEGWTELAVASGLEAPPAFESSPITGIHLWYDREVLDLPHAVLLDSTVQWIFAKEVDERARRDLGARQRLQLVVSASRALAAKGQAEIAALAAAELERALPAARGARVVKAVVVKENRATISISPAVEARRPPARTALANLFLAGDWTRSGWPATLEGSVRSGRLAAAALLDDVRSHLTPELPRSPLARLFLRRSPRVWPEMAATAKSVAVG
jgi:squalene-associated FAD-dependent desaturase